MHPSATKIQSCNGSQQLFCLHGIRSRDPLMGGPELFHHTSGHNLGPTKGSRAKQCGAQHKYQVQEQWKPQPSLHPGRVVPLQVDEGAQRLNLHEWHAASQRSLQFPEEAPLEGLSDVPLLTTDDYQVQPIEPVRVCAQNLVRYPSRPIPRGVAGCAARGRSPG